MAAANRTPTSFGAVALDTFVMLFRFFLAPLGFTPGLGTARARLSRGFLAFFFDFFDFFVMDSLRAARLRLSEKHTGRTE